MRAARLWILRDRSSGSQGWPAHSRRICSATPFLTERLWLRRRYTVSLGGQRLLPHRCDRVRYRQIAARARRGQSGWFNRHADLPRRWRATGKRMPKKGARQVRRHLTRSRYQTELRTKRPRASYGHYKLVHHEWERAGINVPPVFIVVCNNTATSKLLYEWIAGWDRPNADGDLINQHQGHLELFRNYDEHGNRYGIPRTLLIDSAHRIQRGARPGLRGMAEMEIEQFRHELR